MIEQVGISFSVLDKKVYNFLHQGDRLAIFYEKNND
jgi:hypothetical protein